MLLTKEEWDKWFQRVKEETGIELEVCERCRGTGCDYVNGNQQCDDYEGNRMIERGYWDWIGVIRRSKSKEQMSWEEMGREESEKMEEYFQQHPEARKEWERVRPEDVRWEYESITDYSEAFPEYLD
jgi:hypothetical protein